MLVWMVMRCPPRAENDAKGHPLDQLIRDGIVTDYAELVRLGHVWHSRLTLIVNLLCHGPGIQEEILFLPLTERVRYGEAADADCRNTELAETSSDVGNLLWRVSQEPLASITVIRIATDWFSRHDINGEQSRETRPWESLKQKEPAVIV